MDDTNKMEETNKKVTRKICGELKSCYSGNDSMVPLYIETSAYAAGMRMAELKDTASANLKNTLKFDIYKHTEAIYDALNRYDSDHDTRYLKDVDVAIKSIRNCVDYSSTEEFFENLPFCKDSEDLTVTEQEKDMVKFMRWLEKRGFIDPNLSYDTEHQVHTFMTQILPQFK